MPMATTASRKSQPHGTRSRRSSASGRFLAVASLKPVTKRATITSTQADKAVKDYRDSNPGK